MKVNQDELEAHLTLIKAMYTNNTLNNEDYILVTQVLVLADKYDVSLIFKKCKYVLMATPQTLETCEFILERIKNVPNCDDLCEVLRDTLVKEFSPLDKKWTTERFKKLSESGIKLLLSSDKLAVESENTVFVSLMEWMKLHNLSTSSKSLLLRLVRFELMTLNFLFDVVKCNDLAKTIDGFNDLLQSV